MRDNVKRIHDIYAAFGRGDIAAITALTTDDVDWGFDGDVPDALAWLRAGRGRDAVVRYFQGVGASMEFHAFEPKVIAGSGDDVLAIVELTFTAKPTGKRVSGREAMWFTFDEAGHIRRFRLVLDTRRHFGAYEA